MHAAIIDGPDASPRYGEFPTPGRGEGHEPLTLVGAGLHRIVRGLAAGRHYGSSGHWPLVPGVDAVARRPDRALVYTGGTTPPWGTMAELLDTPGGIPLPQGADALAVAAGVNPIAAGWLPLTSRRDEIGSLGTVLILGATGMAGRMAVETALALGADAIVAAGRNSQVLGQLERDRVATAAIGHGGDTDASALAASLGTRTPSLVLDFVWGRPAESAFAALGRHGLSDDDADIAYVQIGSMAGARAAMPAALLRSRRIRITGSGAGSASTEQVTAAIPEIIARIADGSFTVPYRVFAVNDIAQAWAYRGPERVVVTPA